MKKSFSVGSEVRNIVSSSLIRSLRDATLVGLTTYACTQSFFSTGLNFFFTSLASVIAPPTNKQWSVYMQKLGHEGNLTTGSVRYLPLGGSIVASLFTAPLAKFEVFDTPEETLANIALRTGVVAHFYYQSHFYVKEFAKSAFSTSFFTNYSALISPSLVRKRMQKRPEQIPALLLGIPAQERLTSMIRHLSVPVATPETLSASLAKKTALFYANAPENFLFISSAYSGMPEKETLVKKHYGDFVHQSTSLEDKLFAALFAHRHNQDDEIERWNDFLTSSARDSVTKEVRVDNHLSMKKIMYAKEESVVLVEKKVQRSKELHSDEQLLEKHLDSKNLYAPLTLPYFVNPDAVLQLYYDTPTFARALDGLSFMQQEKLLLQDIKNYAFIHDVMSSPEFSKRELLDLEAKHLQKKDSREYLAAKEQALKQALPTHDTQQRILLDYHAENRLYNTHSDAFITLDHENKGKGHPLFDLVNLLEHVELPVEWEGMQQRQQLIHAYLKETQYASEALYDDYAAAAFLRQDAFMQAWSSPAHTQHSARVTQLNQNYQLFEQLESYVSDRTALRMYGQETLRLKDSIVL